VPHPRLTERDGGPEQSTDKRPRLADLRESGAIEQGSDVVILLYREDMFEREFTAGRGGGPDCGGAPQRPNQQSHRRFSGPLLPVHGLHDPLVEQHRARLGEDAGEPGRRRDRSVRGLSNWLSDV